MRGKSPLVVLSVLAPLALYFAVRWGGARGAALAIGAVVAARILVVLGRAPAPHRWAALRLPLAALAIAAAGSLVDDPRLVLLVPAVTSAAFLGTFAHSLRATPLVERFARMQKADLSEAEVRYCRKVTVAWCLFLAANTVVIVTLALGASARAWFVYTGGVSYALVGAMLAGEYVLRKALFREYSAALPDRVLARFFPRFERRGGCGD